MSAPAARSRNTGDALGVPSSLKGPSANGLGLGSSQKLRAKSAVCERENDDPSRGSAGRRGEVNCTYVISARQTPGDTALTPSPAGRLALQRRVTRNRESSLLGTGLGESPGKVAETSLTLQRRAPTGSAGRRTAARTAAGAPRETGAGATTVSGDTRSLAAPAAPSAEGTKDAEPLAGEKCKERLSALSGADDSVTLQYLRHSTPVGPRSRTQVERSGHLAGKPAQSKWDTQVPGPGNSRHPSAGKDAAKTTPEFGSSETRTPAKRPAEPRLTPRAGAPRLKRPETSSPGFQVRPKPKGSLLANKGEGSQERTLPPQEESAVGGTAAERGPLKVESSQVTVAVRVRPFSKRERDENSAQVVFMDGEEIAVRHPDMRHVYNFVYDVSFWSFDEGHPCYAGQAAVYGTLAAPLLARALEGYNACLFAYGQTGSGKSYTMMGFGEEPGIIPRFCEDLFAQVAKTPEVKHHFEMSFFEIYNEKIHDLLVCKGESGQTKQPLRVREHPVSGPYVEALTVNAVSSYSDVQGWLELGSKQRATAATGMNDKSSRSHAVLSLLVTRTQTECVDGEELEHRVTSRVNLVDLAGSERCGPAGTCGQQLREGVSINRSLLTLGKVVSALAEHGGRKGVFVPYRESVLTWLLKESLGGNSKTAMVATVSPAASSVEETLSTLRYARQARSIVNVARVNEDASAQLIRDLKAEIEKLKAAQRSHQNIDPERYRLCRQEVASLRMQLHRQERDMAEMQRAWKEKFEEAERRKHEEMKELQKAGIAFRMDTCSPSLVNLSADPQLSETLFYVIKEGTTTVGKGGPTSSPDIRLSGVLVAEDHCTIRHVGGAVSLVPLGEAKTYVNGRLLLEPTELHHGDRVVLGGDHYFRLNHPAEVQAGEGPAGADTPTRQGREDFEFAKNELLAAQREELEAEVREARLRAKQELLRSAQIAQEVAARELAEQRAAYERRIEALEAQLREESQRKETQEASNRKAAHRIEELERAKQRLEQEVHVSRKRLEVESLAAKQALEDHSVRHARILEALEAEKQKLAEEVQVLQRGRSGRDRAPAARPGWGALKLSLMLQEANAIGSRLRSRLEFGRHEPLDGGCGTEARVRVRNLSLGVSTVWSLEKFESKLAAMKELYESGCTSQGEDLFCDPEDEWEADLAGVPVSSLSRRRSRSLVKNRRVSGYLHGVQAQSARKPPPSRAPGSTEEAGCADCGSSGPRLPGICRDVIGSSLAVLGQSHEDRTAADSLVRDLLDVYGGLLAIARAHADQDEDGQDDLFSSDCATQARAAGVACAFGRLAVLATHWPGDAPPGPGAARLGDELRTEVRRLGSYLQVFLQGCCSDLSSVVEDAQQRVARAVRQAAKCVGQLAALSGTDLHLPGDRGAPDAGLQEDLADAVRDGVGSGLSLLLGRGLEKAEALRRELLRPRPQSQVARQRSARAAAFTGSLGHAFAEWKTQCSRIQAQGGRSGCEDLERMVACASAFLKLERGLEQTAEVVLSALRGPSGDADLLRTCVESVCSMARGVAEDMGAASVASCRDLESEAQSLLLCFEPEERPASPAPGEAPHRTGGAGQQPSWAGGPGSGGHKGVPKRVYELPTSAPRAPQGCLPSRTQWV
ncbi:kinesin-like protein KIF14 isoform X1 [Phyllostomus hastatus]|uniref:kinesin-like protein KIF14 isoform X1 n=1 Tax=Phyllostomus hastatus TaxID=9423 RepID=UPI001E682D25|nr:kinesin-like protein KIF14 isoform X1 [Phyllostomus hastatus]